MGRKLSNSKDLFRNLKGWEKQYLQRAEKYGHLEAKNNSKTNNRRDK